MSPPFIALAACNKVLSNAFLNAQMSKDLASSAYNKKHVSIDKQLEIIG